MGQYFGLTEMFRDSSRIEEDTATPACAPQNSCGGRALSLSHRKEFRMNRKLQPSARHQGREDITLGSSGLASLDTLAVPKSEHPACPPRHPLHSRPSSRSKHICLRKPHSTGTVSWRDAGVDPQSRNRSAAASKITGRLFLITACS